MTDLHGVLEPHVSSGALPGAVALVARGDRVEFAAVGALDVAGTAPMTRESIFRFASITKPITAAALLALVDDGRVGLHDPIGRWLPELAAPAVVRTPASELDDVVPLARPITVFDLLTSQAGHGFASDFSLPAVRRLFAVQKDGREPQAFPATDEWLAELSEVPLLYQPGESWLYDTSSAVQGALIARASGRSLPEFLAERVFAPLGMTDTGFVVPQADRGRCTTFYKAEDGVLRPADGPDGQWSTPPAFPLGSGGLVGTADDWFAFARVLLAGGVADGRRVLSAEAVRLMTTDHTTPAHREIGALFLEGQGWGMGGSVDIAVTDPWTVPGRYGWVGGTGTSAHVVPATGTVAILLTQVGADSPVAPEWMRDFWRYAA
ncbi:serine hydrolase domain-containing protein [Actinosynnema sp. NPDC047251]|uniref:Beta-lactamase, class C n=1 Tax=Saccharothrix espanaensis (strain ATCC 51144 / DSM 44229 / JCM 9112 / NBRC 15066 / NRRL 15764) TaxID=1179773 RepID=K0K2V2_SACES|nr:serine hydrolase domain-containing protein [Saccharothrix espanaensis]CCH30903.1 beta-lactamase, class C [Saccharothrix espanaensis DSM 44229]